MIYDITNDLTTKVPSYVWDKNPTEFREWCIANSVYYYGRPAESYSLQEAIKLAIKSKLTKILLENLS